MSSHKADTYLFIVSCVASHTCCEIDVGDLVWAGAEGRQYDPVHM